MKILNLAMLLALATAVGCKEPNNPPPPIAENEIISVPINITNEIDLGEDLPFTASNTYTNPSTSTKTETKDLIAVQVYQVNNGAMIPYARGVFGAFSFPQLELVKNQTYAIETTVIIDGQQVIARRASDGAYYRPMSVGSIPEKLSDTFTYAPTPHSGISSGTCDIVNGQTYTPYNHPLIERYAGYSGHFVASQSTPINIVAKRVYSALRFLPEGLSNGSIEFSINGSPKIILPAATNMRDTTISIALSGAKPASSEWTENNYGETITFSIAYISPSGDRTVLTPTEGKSLTIIRNHVHPIRLLLNKPSTPSISLETTEMPTAPESTLTLF